MTVVEVAITEVTAAAAAVVPTAAFLEAAAFAAFMTCESEAFEAEAAALAARAFTSTADHHGRQHDEATLEK